MALTTLNNGDSGLDARTKINAAIAAINAGSGSFVSGIAFVDGSNGNDGSGDGSAAKPFKTLQAAYNAGIVHPAKTNQHTFFIVGNVGQIAVSEDNVILCFIGMGRELSIVFGVTVTGTRPTIIGNGSQMVTIGYIQVSGVNGSNGATPTVGGTPGEDGQGGTSPGEVNIRSCHLSSAVYIYGGNGGNGGNGQVLLGNNGQPGGKGGNGGSPDELYITDCEIDGDVISYGGAGGAGGNGSQGFNGMGEDFNSLQSSAGDGGDGGPAGSGGLIYFVRSKAHSIGSFDGTPGNGGNPGDDVGTGAGNAGASGFYGSSRTRTLRFSEMASDPGGSGDYKASVVSGVFHGDS